MSLKSVNTEEKNRAVLEINIPKADFEAEVTKVYRKNAANITIPGFRKGKAPRSIIEKMYGKGVFYEDALNNLLPSVLEEALKESGIEAVSQAELELGEIDDNGVALTAKYYTKPEITVTAYKGLEAEKTVRRAGKEEVDAELSRVQERNSRTVEVVDRACEKDDIAVIDYEGFIGGEAFQGGKDSAHHLKIGSGQFIPGFEEQIIGHKIGDEFDVTVTFPENYHAEDLKGKEAVFKVALNGIEKVELPKIDDDFAKDVSEFDTLSEYKKDIKAKIEKSFEEASNREVEEQLLEKVVSSIEGEIPQCMFDNEADNMMADFENRIAQQGLSMEMYMQYTGMTAQKMKEEFGPQAERQVKAQLALEAIAKAEKMTATEEELEKEYNRVSELYQIELEKAKQFIPKETIEKDVLARKAVDLIKETAKITEKPYVAEVKEAAEKAPAKKTAAKKAPAKKAATGEKAEKAPAKKAPAKKAASKKED